MTDPKRAKAVRAAWGRLQAQLRAAPATDALKLAREIVVDIEALFPAPAPQQRSGNVIDFVAWLGRSNPRSASGR